MTPAQAMRLQALKARLFDDLLAATRDFEDDDEHISGADFVEGFARFRRTAVERIREVENPPSELKHYIVLYLHPDMQQARFPLVFRCEAESSEGAEEQCASADPDAQVVWVHEGVDYDAALAAYWKE